MHAGMLYAINLYNLQGGWVLDLALMIIFLTFGPKNDRLTTDNYGGFHLYLFPYDFNYKLVSSIIPLVPNAVELECYKFSCHFSRP